MEGSAETWSCGTGSGCCTPTCPRGLLEEECRTLERKIPVLQVSCIPGPTPRLPGLSSEYRHGCLLPGVRVCLCAYVHVKVV